VAKGQKYMTLVYDLEQATVEHIGMAAVRRAWTATSGSDAGQVAGIEALAIDMWDPSPARSSNTCPPRGQDRLRPFSHHGARRRQWTRSASGSTAR